MNVQKIKQYAFALALAVTFIIAPGLSNMSAVQAKDKYEKERKEKKYRKDHDDDRDEWRERRRHDDDWWFYRHRLHRFDRFHRGFVFRHRF